MKLKAKILPVCVAILAITGCSTTSKTRLFTERDVAFTHLTNVKTKQSDSHLKRARSASAFLPNTTTTTVGTCNGPQMFTDGASEKELDNVLATATKVDGVSIFLFGNLPTIKTYKGSRLDLHLMARNTPEGYEADALPVGLKLDPNSGVITGQTMEPGVYLVKLTAFGPRGKGFGTLKIIVDTATDPSPKKSLFFKLRHVFTGESASPRMTRYAL